MTAVAVGGPVEVVASVNDDAVMRIVVVVDATAGGTLAIIVVGADSRWMG